MAVAEVADILQETCCQQTGSKLQWGVGGGGWKCVGVGGGVCGSVWKCVLCCVVVVIYHCPELCLNGVGLFCSCLSTEEWKK